MSNHRIKLIAALCAIAGFAGSTAARANQDTSKPASSMHRSDSAAWSSGEMKDHSRGSTHASSASEVRPASEHADAKKFDELKGKKVTGTGGEELGQLHDFVIDAKSGKIAHAVVSSGGLLGIGDKLRVVSHDSLKPGEDGLTVQLEKSAFEALPVVQEKDLEAGNITATATSTSNSQDTSSWTGQRDSAAGTDASMKPDSSKTDSSATADAGINTADTSSVATAAAPDALDDDAAVDGGINAGASTSTGSVSVSADVAPSSSTAADTASTPEPTPSASSLGAVASTSVEPVEVTGAPTSTASDASASMHASGSFVLASQLDGKELRSGGEEIGTIQDVAIDLQQGMAMAVVKMKSDAAGGDDLFHVPFSSLQVDSADAQSVSTTLARSDFMQTTSTTGISATSTTSSSEETLSPTGPSSESYSATASNPTATAAAEDDADATDAAKSTTNSTSSSYYGSATGSTSATSSSDPAATAGQTTEPYGATAGSSGSMQPAGTSAGISGTATTSGNLSETTSGNTAASTPGSSIGSDSSLGTSTTAGTATDSSTSTGVSTSTDVSASTDSSQGIAGPTSSTTAPVTAEEEQLTPTGRDSFQDIGTAAAAIRSQLNSDQNLASEDVRVQEAGKKIMLHGKVSSEDVKERIETLAKQAAGSAEVDSKLKVKEQK